jgi:hypothetical protein
MNLKAIPEAIVDANRERGHSDKQIERMPAEKLFDEFCMWHGLINWGRSLYVLANQLNKLENSDKSAKKS